ncbi:MULTISPECIES: ABC transporter permease [unclassified Variovorax]|jgi:ABC-type dipeptide/oligopeptide/nickel transport system permease component|uniref:ABC transporter permease n=1 Tax=unclassified Variovorax TaxID=663243 RepID=UPI0019A799F1|nr:MULTISPECIES: ABC transporter permease [unclassified Variovorax]MBC7394119.1 ABC transporter permease [Variovorax sp.]MEB0056828.1 ABC transporter permease [Variovorax sp. LG9.2]MEB0114510.1 ABC transporter permease [Variovorax sp. RTB1]
MPLKRLLWALPTLLGVLVVVFVLLRVAPGDPIAMMIGPGATPDDILALRALYGFDKSLSAQFFIYLGQAALGHFGQSITLKQDVLDLVMVHLPLTLELSALALGIAVLLGGAAALAAVSFRGSLLERGIDVATGFITAIPDFLWGLAGILFLGVLLPVLPVFGLLDSSLRFDSVTGFVLLESLVRGRFDVLGSALYHMLWPALSLALPLAAMIARVLKASLLEVLAQDYILVAQVKGFSPWQVLWREALRNALGPALTLTGVQFTFLIGGTVLIERLFGLPGLGNMAIDAVINRDLPLIQGIVLTFAVLFIAVNLAVDVLNTRINPKLRT